MRIAGVPSLAPTLCWQCASGKVVALDDIFNARSLNERFHYCGLPGSGRERSNAMEGKINTELSCSTETMNPALRYKRGWAFQAK